MLPRLVLTVPNLNMLSSFLPNTAKTDRRSKDRDGCALRFVRSPSSNSRALFDEQVPCLRRPARECTMRRLTICVSKVNAGDQSRSRESATHDGAANSGPCGLAAVNAYRACRSARALMPSSIRRSMAKPIGSSSVGPRESRVAMSAEHATRKRVINRHEPGASGSI